MLKSLDAMGFREPTPIQQQAIPRINSGVNFVGIAQTGTGKTAAYLLPLLSKLRKPEGNDPRLVVLVPTRELSIQVGEDVEAFTAWSELRYAAVFGGIGWTRHAEQIAPGIDVLVATPGRLHDLYAEGVLSLKKVKYLVIDEADRMLDMGFLPQLKQLFGILPSRRQNVLFSATFSGRVEQLCEEFLDFYEKTEAAPPATPVKQVEQVAYRVPNYRTKLSVLNHFLADGERFSRVIVFVKTKAYADGVYKFMKRKTEGAIRLLHSNKGQNTRINAIQAFKGGEVRILVTTDVSARGIDVSQVSHVINFDVPVRHEDYVHRIGRTARAGSQGQAISLVGPAEEWHWKRIGKLIRMEIPLEEIPAAVEVFDTPFDERQQQLREIDDQRKMDDPGFRGAFHQRRKKKRPQKQYADRFQRSKKRQKKRKNRRG